MKGLAFLNWSKKTGPGEHRLHPAAVWLGVTWAICLTLLSFTGLGIYAIVTDRSVYNFSGLVSLVTFLSVLTGGVISGNIARFQGWMHGGLVGVIYSLLLFALALVLAIQEINLNLIGKLLLLVLLGLGGGVVGVNLPAGKIFAGKKLHLKRPRVNLSSFRRNKF